MRVALFSFVIFSLAISVACSKDDSSRYDMTAVTYQQWQQALEQYQGKIVVVDAWATWCESCIKRFPHMVDLAEKYSDENVQFISLNLDDRNATEELNIAREFLETMQADFPHYTMNENMMDAFDKLGFMSLPVVLIYNVDGSEAYRLSVDNPNQQFTDRDVEQAIIHLLNS